MFLHLGENTVILKKNIIGIFDLDGASMSPDTRNFLKKGEDELEVTTIGDEIPKSFVVVTDDLGERIYLSQISSQTLNKRDVFTP